MFLAMEPQSQVLPAKDARAQGFTGSCRGAAIANKNKEERMPLATVSRVPPVDYYILHDAVPAGSVIGLYAGREIRACVIDDLGRRYVYAGIAPRLSNDQFDTRALRDGEFILQPGLVYRLETKPSPWRDGRFQVISKG
jgi:hypothetical protein